MTTYYSHFLVYNYLLTFHLLALSSLFFFFFLMIRRPPRSTLFPYRRSSNFYRFGVITSHSIFYHEVMIESRVVGRLDRKSGSAGMPRPTSYAVSCLKKKMSSSTTSSPPPAPTGCPSPPTAARAAPTSSAT